MKRLRHPIRAIREPFGKAGLTVAILALVLAMVGGAYAASGGLSGKQKKEVEKIAKKFAGKPGANGTNGSPGAKGDPGTSGTNGTPGANGKSVAVTQISEGDPGECEETGGALVKQEGAASGVEVCNGEPAEGGGFPTTLPSETTETGTWAYGKLASAQTVHTAISFTIPLATEVEAHFIPEGGDGAAECPGSAEEPKAAPGQLCVYAALTTPASPAGVIKNPVTGGNASAGTTGGVLILENVELVGRGTWAVTAP